MRTGIFLRLLARLKTWHFSTSGQAGSISDQKPHRRPEAVTHLVDAVRGGGGGGGGNGGGGGAGWQPVFALVLGQHLVEVVATPVVDEEAADVRLRLVADHVRDRLEVLAVLAHACGHATRAVNKRKLHRIRNTGCGIGCTIARASHLGLPICFLSVRRVSCLLCMQGNR